MTNKETVEILMERIARLKENYNANAKSDKELLVGKFVTESGDVATVYGPEYVVTDLLEYHGALANKEQFDSQKFLESITVESITDAEFCSHSSPRIWRRRRKRSTSQRVQRSIW